MSYIHKPNNKPLEHRTPFQILQTRADANPKKEAFVFRDKNKKRVSITFEEYEAKSRLLAAALLHVGLVRGDRVLVMLPSCVEFLLVHMALNRIGANMIVVEEDAYPPVLGVISLACVIARNEIEYSSINHDKVLQNINIALEENNLKAVVIVSASAGPLQGIEKVYIYKELYQMAQNMADYNETVKQAQAAVQMDDPTVVIFTSGTTSIPKPIQYTNFGFMNGVLADAQIMLVDERSIFFSDSPFDWISGLFFGIGVVIAKGSTLITFPPKLAFEGGLVPTIMETIEEEECTHAMMLAYLLHDITMSTEMPDINRCKLKVIFTGGQAAPLALFKEVFDRIPTLAMIDISYGATEINLIANQLLTRDNMKTVDYGLLEIVDGCELKIVDEDDALVPLKTKGELCVRAPWVSFPDWDLLSVEGKPSVIRGTGKGGWHFSNDAASIEDEGRLRLHGRIDDMIKCATETVSPYEIESLLLDHPYVTEACVVGVPDTRLHEKMCACVILNDDQDEKDHQSISKELEIYCRENCWTSTMGLSWKPHYYVFMEEFPKTRTGKLSRKLTREIAVKKLAL